MSKYTQEQIQEMKERMATLDCEVMDTEAIFNVCLSGCIGWNNTPDAEVIADFEDAYGTDLFEDEVEETV